MNATPNNNHQGIDHNTHNSASQPQHGAQVHHSAPVMHHNTHVLEDDVEIKEPRKGGKWIFTILLVVALAIVAFVLWKNPFGGTIAAGDTVTISYVATYENGDVFEAKWVDAPVTFEVGGKQVIPGLSTAVQGMKDGAEKTVKISPKDGYAKYYDPGMVQNIPDVLFRNLREDVVVGKYIKIADLEWVIKDIKEEGGLDVVVLDANPRETWQDLTYDITVLGVQ